MAQERSLDLLLSKLVHRAVERPDVISLQIWLINKGDRCSVCPRRSVCADQRRCLHLVAGVGKTTSETLNEGPPFFDSTQRVPLGYGILGQTAVVGRQTRVRDAAREPDATSNFEWLEAEGVQTCGFTPIQHKGEILGVMAGFAREVAPEEAHLWGRIFADHIGAALANARAFEEIQHLKA